MNYLWCKTERKAQEKMGVREWARAKLEDEGQRDEGNVDGRQHVIDRDAPAAGQSLALPDRPRFYDIEEPKQGENNEAPHPGAAGEECSTKSGWVR